MADPHLQAAVSALTEALGDLLRPSGPGFADLFTGGAVLEVPFDGPGDAVPVRGRAALAAMVQALSGVLHLREVRVDRVMVVDPTTVVCEYEALLDRHDLGQRFRRRYISVLALHDGRIEHLREHGGPFRTTTADHLDEPGRGRTDHQPAPRGGGAATGAAHLRQRSPGDPATRPAGHAPPR